MSDAPPAPPAAPAAILRPGFVPPSQPELVFRIMRQGSAIGEHRVRFRLADGRLTAATEVDIVVKLVGITVFRLRHRFEEVWAEGRLAAATSRLERNGEVTEYVVVPQADALILRGTAGTSRLAPDAAPLTWWDPSRFPGGLFHVYDGRPVQPRWRHGDLPQGGRRWQASGAVTGIATYRADGLWLDWQTQGEDGSRVTYRLKEPAA